MILPNALFQSKDFTDSKMRTIKIVNEGQLIGEICNNLARNFQSTNFTEPCAVTL